MLALPTTGFGRSVAKDNVELDILCDWIEACILFDDGSLKQREVVKTLCDRDIYADQDMADNSVACAWSELRRRQRFLGDGSPYKFDGQAIELAVDPWKDTPGHAFCVLLSLAKWYKDWAKKFGKDYTTQGELFEHLTRESVESQFAGWTVKTTGWSRCNTQKLDAVVTNVADWLGEPKGNIKKWSKVSANEAGLDLVCLKHLSDDRPGRPVFFFQCASGGDWDGKLHTPRLELWRRLVEFTAQGLPKKAFATPFAFLDEEFIQNCNLVDGVLMDRYRLLAGSKTNSKWVSDKLASQIFKWAKPRVAKLAKLEE